MEKELVKDMTPRLIGETYMKYPTKTSRHKRTFGLYECQYCNKEFEAMVSSIKSGTKSCGCQRGLGHKHGLWSHRLYPVWHAMKQRCTNPNHNRYKNYGGRGITVCEEWLDVKNFIEDMYPSYMEGLSLDRIDNDKGYSPDNCRWTTGEIQNTNQRVKSTNTSGFAGVSFGPLKNRWVANIGVNGKRIRIYYFNKSTKSHSIKEWLFDFLSTFPQESGNVSKLVMEK